MDILLQHAGLQITKTPIACNNWEKNLLDFRHFIWSSVSKSK